jgi:DNA topoisomerase-1
MGANAALRVSDLPTAWRRHDSRTAGRAGRSRPAPADPAAAARAAGLVYATDAAPGYSRRKRGNAFVYLKPSGVVLKDPRTLARIRSLVIPPAWTGVWVCVDPRGHLQATGRDVRGRKQYRYHPQWREVRDETKYYRTLQFARALPAIRRRTAADLAGAGLTKTRVLAAVVQLLEKTLIRVGNDEYARQNRSYGLTTLRDGHVRVTAGRLRFSFRGKSGVEHEIDLDDRRLARVVKACRDIPGYDLFQYYDENRRRQTIGSADVNEYLREITGEPFTSKDFRTWAGTVLAARLLRDFEAFESQAQAKKNIVQAVESVARRLGNTKAVCRKCYIHPAVFDAYLDGAMMETVARRARTAARAADRLTEAEAAVRGLLQRRLAKESRRRGTSG